MATGKPWFNAGDLPDLHSDFLNLAMRDYCIAQAKRHSEWHKQMHIWYCHGGEYETCRQCFPVYTWYQKLWFRIRSWWDAHYPRVHFGPCPDDYC